MIGNNSLSYALQPQSQGHASTAANIATLSQPHHTAAAATSYPYRYPAQSQYVQQQQYPAFQGLSRVTTQPQDYSPVKLEESYVPPLKYEESADEWQASHVSQQQHLDPIQPFVRDPYDL